MKNIGWIAIGGLAIGIAASGLAGAITVDDDQGPFGFTRHFHHAWNPRWFNWNQWSNAGDDCYDGAVADTKESERHLAWDGGDDLTIAVPAMVHYRAGEGTEVIVRGDPEAVGRVFVRAGKIVQACGSFHGGDLDITLPGREFRNVVLERSADLTMENIHQSDLSLNIAGSGTARASGSADKMTTTVSGSGKVTLAGLTMKKLDLNIAGSGSIDGTGTSDTANVAIEGSGEASLGEVAVKEIAITIAGSGGVSASPKDKADVTIMGSGNVTLLTRPDHISTNIMGSGKIVQAPVKTGKET